MPLHQLVVGNGEKNMRNVEHEHKNGSMNVMNTNVKFHDINDG